MLVLGEEFAAGDARILHDGIGLGNKFLPVVALGICGIGNENAEVGGAFVGHDIELVAEDLGAVKEVLAGGDFDGSIL